MALLASQLLLILAACQQEPEPTDPSVETDNTETGTVSETGTPTPESGDTGTEPLLSWVYAEVGKDAKACGLISDGTVRCWGAEGWIAVAPPEDVVFQQIHVEGDAACGVLEDGEIACWCLDTGLEENPLCTEPWPSGPFVRVEVGSGACAQRADDTITCFGGGIASGAPDEPLLDFEIGEGACGVRLNGELFCWFYPALTEDLELPPGPFTQVVLGRQHVCGLDTAGDMRCIGGLAEDTPTPEVFPGPFTVLNAEHATFCGLLADGHPSCWWSDADAVIYGWGAVPDLPFAQLGIASSGGCGVLLDGSATCWSTIPSIVDIPDL
jgi:hypothetical protein